MKFGSPPPQRANQDRAIVPMINVVFLLLIFFLMTASLTVPAPFALDPPIAQGEVANPQPGSLMISATGELVYGDARGQDAVFASLARRAADPADGAPPLAIRADAALPAQDLAQLLSQLAEIRAGAVTLVAVSP
jgi:biopolymer transport protein ExbD